MYCCQRTSPSTSITSEMGVKFIQMTRSGLIPGGRSLKRDRQSVFFTAVNPMDDDQSMEEIRCDLDKPTIAPYIIPGCLIKTQCIGGLQIYQTRSHAIVLYNTVHAICIEKAVCMKTKEEVYQKFSILPGCFLLYWSRTRKVVAFCYTEAELAKWTAGSTWARSKKILWPPKRIGKLVGNPQRQRWL